jgi:protein-S-isoprenylcysteine O-methyltransferase Ste14
MKFPIGRVIFPLIVYFGGTLVGWGLDDVIGYFSHPARVGFILEALVANWIETVIISTSQACQERKEVVAAQQNVYSTLMGIRFIAGIVFYPFADRRNIGTFMNGEVWRYTGLILYVVGYSISNWAIIKLGQQWSGMIVVQESHKLVTDGPYTHVRHPHYLGVLFVGFGASIIFRSWIGILLWMIVDSAYLRERIRDEEAMLHKRFGKEWEEYCKRTWRLMPLIY